MQRDPDLDQPSEWDRAVEAAGPASLLLLIVRRTSPALRATWPAEDILQEAMLHAWRARSTLEWRGLPAFRRWLISIIEHRIADLADQVRARKRGDGRSAILFSELRSPTSPHGEDAAFDVPISTTPGRIASYREQAEIYRESLESLPLDQREVLYLRLFEQLESEEIADRLGLGIQAVRYRLRTGAQAYGRAMHRVLHSRSRTADDAGVS